MPQALTVELSNARTLRYRTMAQKSVRRESIRIAVSVTALVSSGNADALAIEKRALEALNSFVRADWLLSSPQRNSETAGYERIALTATTRVALNENYNLAERTRLASTEGLSLQDPQVSYIIPAQIVSEAVQDLRLEILVDAQRHSEQFAARSGGKWDIADIAYGVHAEDFGLRSGKGAYRSELDDLDEEKQKSEAGAERVRVFADIVLRSEA